jgi:transcriptional regulator with XRE-family HTH domain
MYASELAQLIDRSPSYVSAIVCGRRRPNQQDARNMAEALGVKETEIEAR